MNQQESFFKQLSLNVKAQKLHGGTLSRGKRKVRRPLDLKKPLHLVLKSSKARGQYSFLKSANMKSVNKIIFKQAQKHGVRIAAFANVGNHLHLYLRFFRRAGFQNFLRSVTSFIARIVTGARRGQGFGNFWDALAFTRVISSKKEDCILRKYIFANVIESKEGYGSRKKFLDRRKKWEHGIYERKSLSRSTLLAEMRS